MHRIHCAFDAPKNWLRRRNKREGETGQSIVIMVLGLVGLMAFAGLVFDGGTAYAQFRRMQNAADAGALAGANELSKKNTPDGTTHGQVCATALNYAHSLNGQTKDPDWQTDPEVQVQYILPDPTDPTKYTLRGVPGCHVGAGSNPSGKPPDDAKGIRVTTSTTFKTFFLKMVGIGTGTSTAHSSAEYGPATPLNVQPLAKRCPDTDPPCNLNIGIYGPIWQSTEPGNLGWLGFNGDVNTPNLRQEFDPDAPKVPYIDDVCMVDYVPRTPCKTLGLGCWVQGTTGDVSAIQGELEDEWQFKDKPMIIVLYDRQLEKDPGNGTLTSGGTCGGGGGGGSQAEFHVVGFAAFQLGEFDLSGGGGLPKYMKGTFVRWMDSAAICKDCADTGLYSVHLVPDIVEPPVAASAKGTICVTVGYDIDPQLEPPPPLPNPGTYYFHEGQDYYLAGATVTIRDAGGNIVGSTPWNTLGTGPNCTGATLNPGTYTVTEANPSGYVDVTPNSKTVTVAAGGTEDVLFLDTWTDTGNLVVLTRDDHGAVLPSLAAVLKPASNPAWIIGGPIKSPTGTVYFRNRPPGNYIVSGVPDPGYDMVVDNVPVTITLGSTFTTTIVAQKYPVGKICVRVWDDDDNSGPPNVNSPPDKSLWGAVITLAGTENRTHTMGDGEYDYCFENLRLGPYTVSQSHPPGYSSATGSPDSWAGSLTYDGEVVQRYFRDYVPPRGNICVEVFDDVTNNGLFDPLEVRLAGANISIIDWNNTAVIPSYITTGYEPKCFSVGIGTYKVVENNNPPGYLSTTPDTREGIVISKDMATTIDFGDRAHAATATPTSTKTPTPTRTNTRPANWTPSPTPTVTQTPIPGSVCVSVYQDLDGDGTWDYYPAATATPTGTLTMTPEPILAPKSVGVRNSFDVPTVTWDGTGPQAHCFPNLWPDSYGVTETDPLGYSSTTANNVTALVTSSYTTTVEFGDKLCFAAPPHMRDPIWINGNQYMLQWDNLPGTFYTIYGSSNSIDPEVPTWTAIGEASSINYYVERNQGPYFYVVATDNCGTSGPSNVVATGVTMPTLTPTPTATRTATATLTPTATPTR